MVNFQKKVLLLLTKPLFLRSPRVQPISLLSLLVNPVCLDRAAVGDDCGLVVCTTDPKSTAQQDCHFLFIFRSYEGHRVEFLIEGFFAFQ